MAWATPERATSGTTATAASFDNHADDLDYLKGQTDALAASAVKVNRTSSQSIPDSTATAIVWNNQIGDLGGYWSSGANITMPSDYPAGVTTYLCVAHLIIKFATNATGTRQVQTLLNGSAVDTVTFGGIAGDPTIVPFTSTFFAVAEGDVITVEVTQTSGGALNVTGAVITLIRQYPSG
jgi:hypothetical protein